MLFFVLILFFQFMESLAPSNEVVPLLDRESVIDSDSILMGSRNAFEWNKTFYFEQPSKKNICFLHSAHQERKTFQQQILHYREQLECLQQSIGDQKELTQGIVGSYQNQINLLQEKLTEQESLFKKNVDFYQGQLILLRQELAQQKFSLYQDQLEKLKMEFSHDEKTFF